MDCILVFLLDHRERLFMAWRPCWIHAGFSAGDRPRYAQQPLHRAVFTSTYPYTERFVHRYFFYTKLHKDAFTHTNGFTQRGSYAQIDALRLNSWSRTFRVPLPKFFVWEVLPRFWVAFTVSSVWASSTAKIASLGSKFLIPAVSNVAEVATQRTCKNNINCK